MSCLESQNIILSVIIFHHHSKLQHTRKGVFALQSCIASPPQQNNQHSAPLLLEAQVQVFPVNHGCIKMLTPGSIRAAKTNRSPASAAQPSGEVGKRRGSEKMMEHT
uniref:PPUP8644 n=1 Tax=Poeciliopsis prolifica TaxID=188132 RepID=A0A0S7EKJ0_9TELE